MGGASVARISKHQEESAREKLLEKMKLYSTVREYRPGQKILVSGDEASALYYVKKGCVEVSYTHENTRVVVALIGQGEFFGEIGFFDGGTRVRDIAATAETVIMVFGEDNASRMMEADPALHARFLFLVATSVCQRFKRILEEREPLQAYAASLSAGRRKYYTEITPVPENLYDTPLWKEVYQEVENFKGGLYELANSVQMMHAEDIPEEFFGRCSILIDSFNDKLEQLDASIKDSRIKEYLIGYIFKEIFPYFMRSRFAQRTYFKPKGYAGDFLMMEAIYRNVPEGDGNLGLLIDAHCLQCPPARAVRGRRKMLAGLLSRYAEPLIAEGRRVRIMNLACGSNRELFDFLAGCSDTSLVEATCIDADRDALEFTNREVNNFPHEATIRFMQDNVVKWSLGRVRHEFSIQDIIYSAGLTDYLDARLFLALVNRIYEHLRPGGTAIICNFAPSNPHRAWVDHILQWKLIYRTEDDMRELFDKSRFGPGVELFTEDEGITIFAVAIKG